MTFQIKANPTIDATITIVGQGREQQLNVTYRHKTGKEYDALMKQLDKGKITIVDLLLELVEKWDADLPISKESLDLLREHQPGADLAIATAYNTALNVERKKN
jgi:hypothetical protein